MIFDYENQEIQIKLVYYGPAMSGKTTSIRYLFSCFGKQDELESIESTVGRTLFFDFGVLKFEGVNWGIKFLLYSATGQDFYASTRPSTLNGVDGIIFVADSQKKRLNHNIQSWEELRNLIGPKMIEIPVIIALNKSDLLEGKKLKKGDIIDQLKISNLKNISFIKTTAIKGVGIMKSFQKIINYIFPELNIQMVAEKC